MNDYNYFYKRITEDEDNHQLSKKGLRPLFSFSDKSKIILIGQAPGAKTHISGRPWADASGKRLRSWLGVDDEVFYNPDNFAFVPMDFYFPGATSSGDVAPRRSFAKKWHPEILASISDPQLILLIGSHAQNYYLEDGRSLSERVLHYKEYLPKYFVMVHPSPRNAIWLKKNPGYEKFNLPELRKMVLSILGCSSHDS